MAEERAVLVGGCFWGMHDLIRGRKGRRFDAGQLYGWRCGQPDLSQSWDAC
jgi:peptide methionine sulfoxide reductase MsrA